MGAEVAEKIEMRREARVGQHAPGVAAHREDLAAFDEMMSVELERVGLLRHASFIDDRLAVILASRLEPVELEQPIGRREELRLAELRPHRLVLDIDRPAGHQPRIEEPRLFRHGDKVVPIERAAEALAIQQGIGLDLVGQTPVAIDIGEIELAARASSRSKAPRNTAGLSTERLITQFDTITSKLAGASPSSPSFSI